MRAVIHALKYDRMHPAARRLGAMLAVAIAQLADHTSAEMLVIPVPLHRSRQNERGFNQARLLAEHALKALHVTHPEWKLALAPSTLMRLRRTESQAHLTPRQRRINVRGAFTVSDVGAVRNRHILLIDDVFTSGATARAAAQVLKRAGAASVWVATLARARRISAGTPIDGNTSFVQPTTHEPFGLPGCTQDDELERTSKHSSTVHLSFSRGQRDVAG